MKIKGTATWIECSGTNNSLPKTSLFFSAADNSVFDLCTFCFVSDVKHLLAHELPRGLAMTPIVWLLWALCIPTAYNLRAILHKTAGNVSKLLPINLSWNSSMSFYYVITITSWCNEYVANRHSKLSFTFSRITVHLSQYLIILCKVISFESE